MIDFLGKENYTHGTWTILIPITIKTEHLFHPLNLMKNLI